MSESVTLASWKTQIFEAVLGFLPDWLQMTLIGLVLALLVAYWGVSLKRKIAHRRAVRSGQPIHAAAQYGQGRGADHLGQYAQPQPAQQGRGADHLGQYAQPQSQPGQQGSGADYLGQYAQPHANAGDAPRS
ncbi:hypothetical protein AB0M97_24720 [Streptomyces sp. NPDC051207]|uniref:hypothetical protein n=1 Tax=Streptomyces sp. NPDC051207 TaxID=3154641 RepID=UPI00343ED23F